MFHVDQRGVVSSLASINREQYDAFRFPVVAVDSGTPSRTGSNSPSVPGTSTRTVVLRSQLPYFLPNHSTPTLVRTPSSLKSFVLSPV